jgi:hypothetical protein
MERIILMYIWPSPYDYDEVYGICFIGLYGPIDQTS